MTESIRGLLDREPFQPFRIRASSGETYAVRQPGLVVLLKSQVFIAEPNSDRFSIVPLLHVAGVELLGNGRLLRSTRRRCRTLASRGPRSSGRSLESAFNQRDPTTFGSR